MRISCSIDYWSDTVATFDPQKVLARFRAAFLEIRIDLRDQSAEEVERLRAYLTSEADIHEEVKDKMLRQLQDKAMRNGPVYAVELPVDDILVKGTVSRYSINLMVDGSLDRTHQDRFVEFLKTLALGQVEVSR